MQSMEEREPDPVSNIWDGRPKTICNLRRVFKATSLLVGHIPRLISWSYTSSFKQFAYSHDQASMS